MLGATGQGIRMPFRRSAHGPRSTGRSPGSRAGRKAQTRRLPMMTHSGTLSRLDSSTVAGAAPAFRCLRAVTGFPFNPPELALKGTGRSGTVLDAPDGGRSTSAVPGYTPPGPVGRAQRWRTQSVHARCDAVCAKARCGWSPPAAGHARTLNNSLRQSQSVSRSRQTICGIWSNDWPSPLVLPSLKSGSTSIRTNLGQNHHERRQP